MAATTSAVAVTPIQNGSHPPRAGGCGSGAGVSALLSAVESLASDRQHPEEEGMQWPFCRGGKNGADRQRPDVDRLLE